MPKTKTTKPINGFTEMPMLSVLDCHKIFLTTIADDGFSKSTVSDFLLKIALPLLNSGQPISLTAAVNISRHLEFDVLQLKELFPLWAGRMCQLGKLRELPPALYDEPIYHLT